MSEYAVVQVGTHQYRVEPKTEFDVELFELPKGKEVKLDQVLLLEQNNKTQVGQPVVPKATVTCEVVKEYRLPKVISFKFKRRKGFKKKKGHRQEAIRLRVTSIKVG
jgi:large subunit ribosomal protein L21